MNDTHSDGEPCWRASNPAVVAKAAARFLAVDPVFWLERAGLAGLIVSLSGQGLSICYSDSDVDEANFLTVWLHETPGAARAVAEVLRRRGLPSGTASRRAGGKQRGA